MIYYQTSISLDSESWAGNIFFKESKKLYHKISLDGALDDDDVRSAEGWTLLLLSP